MARVNHSARAKPAQKPLPSSLWLHMWTGLGSAAAEVYVAVAFDCVIATGYEVFDAGYVLEDLLIAITATKVSQLQCDSSL